MHKLKQRIITMSLLCLALPMALVRQKYSGRVERILIVQNAKLGDMVCTTPMFRSVKRAFPGSYLAVFGDPTNALVLEGNPHIDEYIKNDMPLLQLYRILRKKDIDALCVTAPYFKLLALGIIARVPLIVVPRIRGGWSPYETKPYVLLSRFVTTRDHTMGHYAPREYLRLLEPLRIFEEDTRKEVFFTEEARRNIDVFLMQNGVDLDSQLNIGILPGAGNEIKAWPPEKFAELMNLIALRSDVVFLLLGIDKDRERADIIKNNVTRSVVIVDCIGKQSIDELKACICRLSLVIGADTGPQYIAEACSVPTIDIVGPVDEREQPPVGDLHRIVKIDRERPELYVMNARVYNKQEAIRQRDQISADMVYKEYLELVSNFMS